jgi:hypothetical protein
MISKDYLTCPQYTNGNCNLKYISCSQKYLCCFKCKTKGCRWRCVTTDNMSDLEREFYAQS